MNPMFNSAGFVLSVGQLIQLEASVAELCRYSHCDARQEREEWPHKRNKKRAPGGCLGFVADEMGIIS